MKTIPLGSSFRTRLISPVGLSLLLGSLFGTSWTILADDWPQWMGPNRDSVWRETGIIRSISATSGLSIKWRAAVELGYSGPSVADNRVFVMDYLRSSGSLKNNPGDGTTLEGQERILCFSAHDGKKLWELCTSSPTIFLIQAVLGALQRTATALSSLSAPKAGSLASTPQAGRSFGASNSRKSTARKRRCGDLHRIHWWTVTCCL